MAAKMENVKLTDSLTEFSELLVIFLHTKLASWSVPVALKDTKLTAAPSTWAVIQA